MPHIEIEDSSEMNDSPTFKRVEESTAEMYRERLR